MRSCSLLLIPAVLISSAALAQSPYLSKNAPQQHTQRADNFPYWYLGLNAQLSFVDKSDVSSPATGITGIDYDTGVGLGAAIGFRPYTSTGFYKDTRFELEYTYRDVEASSYNIGAVSNGISADFVTNSVMLNMFYDFQTGTSFTPYVGAGLGAAFVDVDSATLGINDQDEVFAYQGMLGVAYSPELLPDTQWGIGYRYVGMSDPEFTTSTGSRIETDYQSHNLELLSRFRF